MLTGKKIAGKLYSEKFVDCQWERQIEGWLVDRKTNCDFTIIQWLCSISFYDYANIKEAHNHKQHKKLCVAYIFYPNFAEKIFISFFYV